ncbi:MAG: hypothetical protein A2381_04265 [Bdellovibrionales bacterium RIFOXYB1_FULL_37_110]|nr:MAG: hypothetical protein A2181_09490 [Bdellovibrionales bacterium RIFOXYA1_FULL_38_20]OFZ46605.1 MAG: hypothetical protein A2417_04550 [Bdellovibrionales bacterium RIFOXYC1_FULL_37_79]OFZ55476.1 MAG: hypothetical protein A2328_07825 [Bdellovibrionales bacterium RIFOXYB2_FULL_36_6]OFZ57459.1 MAG: hypothetical protein A2381_04265 [Bdellovibrionales bacterium RIFOXYB1_FULL_37_110]OFZ64544.1 MAG: hypothetical protein A2577_13740 [Bdellovibrionales bacterium RIFOXYD1_FULL_36_51]
MNLEFCKYFFKYIFVGKNKQRLLLLSIAGLFISTFALFVLQSTMGGLQNNQIIRMKRIQGEGVIYLSDKSYEFAKEVLDYLKARKIHAVSEVEIELMLRNKTYISPIILHGINQDGLIPDFLQNIPLSDLVLPIDLAIKMDAQMGDALQIITPAYADTFLGDIPRSTTAYIDYILSTNVPEIDAFHAWTNIRLIWNLIRKKEINQIRVYNIVEMSSLKEELLAKFKGRLSVNLWEDENKTLVMALNLETTVMTFLFVAMTMLVSLCITSGLMIFLGKVKHDFASFWILGTSEKRLETMTYHFLNLLNLSTVFMGLLGGFIFLILLDKYGVEIMPDVFVDRKIPIYMTVRGALVSVLIPYVISMVFAYFSLSQFKKEVSYLDYVRTVG